MTKCVKQTFPKEAERSSNFVPSKKINTLKNSYFKEKIPLTLILFRPDLSFNACHSTTTAKKLRQFRFSSTDGTDGVC